MRDSAEIARNLALATVIALGATACSAEVAPPDAGTVTSTTNTGTGITPVYTATPTESPTTNTPTATETNTQHKDDNEVTVGLLTLVENGAKDSAAELNRQQEPIIEKALDTFADYKNDGTHYIVVDEGKYPLTIDPVLRKKLTDPTRDADDRNTDMNEIINGEIKKHAKGKRPDAWIVNAEFAKGAIFVPKDADGNPLPTDLAKTWISADGSPLITTYNAPEISTKPGLKTYMHEFAHWDTISGAQGYNPYMVREAHGMFCEGLVDLLINKHPADLAALSEGACAIIPYGDHTTVMGSDEKYFDKYDPYSGINLEQMGALPKGKIAVIPRGKDTTVVLDTLANRDGSNKSLAVVELPKSAQLPIEGIQPEQVAGDTVRLCLFLEVSSKITQEMKADPNESSLKAKLSYCAKKKDAKGNTELVPFGDTYLLPLNDEGSIDPTVPANKRGTILKYGKDFGIDVVGSTQGENTSTMTLKFHNMLNS